MADYSALATIPLVEGSGRVFYAPQVNTINQIVRKVRPFLNLSEEAAFRQLLVLRLLCTLHIQYFSSNHWFCFSGASGQKPWWRGKSEFSGNPPLLAPRSCEPEQPDCNQGDTTFNSCHGCHFSNLNLIHCSSPEYPHPAQALCLDARKSSEIFLYVDVDVCGAFWLKDCKESPTT